MDVINAALGSSDARGKDRMIVTSSVVICLCCIHIYRSIGVS